MIHQLLKIRFTKSMMELKQMNLIMKINHFYIKFLRS